MPSHPPSRRCQLTGGRNYAAHWGQPRILRLPASEQFLVVFDTPDPGSLFYKVSQRAQAAIFRQLVATFAGVAEVRCLINDLAPPKTVKPGHDHLRGVLEQFAATPASKDLIDAQEEAMTTTSLGRAPAGKVGRSPEKLTVAARLSERL